jgi:hypothetical protein
MNRARQIFFCAALAVPIFSAHAQVSAPPVPAASQLMPPMPQNAVSPVAFFRQLLAMPPAERNAALTNRPPEVRERIKAKVREYLALDPDERELRLRATELRWWLAPLFKLAPADRAGRVAAVPAEWRGIVQARLAQWDALSAELQKEFLENDKTLHYFARVETANTAAASPEQQKVATQFNQFFELTPGEKSQALNTLSIAERAAMQRTLNEFDRLPAPQRRECVRNYAKFAGMGAAERMEFLKNAERWAQMSPQERQSWRDLVARVPMEPPQPPAILPANLIPHPAPKNPRGSVATN